MRSRTRSRSDSRSPGAARAGASSLYRSRRPVAAARPAPLSGTLPGPPQAPALPGTRKTAPRRPAGDAWSIAPGRFAPGPGRRKTDGRGHAPGALRRRASFPYRPPTRAVSLSRSCGDPSPASRSCPPRMTPGARTGRETGSAIRNPAGPSASSGSGRNPEDYASAPRRFPIPRLPRRLPASGSRPILMEPC